MQRLIWPIVAGAALTLALWASGGSEPAPRSAQQSVSAARPTSQIAPAPRQVIRPSRPIASAGSAAGADARAAQRQRGAGARSVDETSLVRSQGEVIRPDRESIMAQRAAEARRLAQERAALLEARRQRYDEDAAQRRQRELADMRRQQNELAAAQSRLLLSGQATSQRQTRTAPTPVTSNLARSAQQPAAGGSSGQSTADQLGAAGGELSDAIDAFQEQTSAQGQAGGNRGLRGGDGVRIGDPQIQSLIDSLTGSGFSESAARDLVSLATGGRGGGSGGAAGLIPTVTTLFGSTDDGTTQTGGDSDQDGASNDNSDDADSGGSQDDSDTGNGSGSPPGGAGGDADDRDNSGDSDTGGDPPPGGEQNPPPAPAASLVGVSLTAGAVVGGGTVSASVRIVQAVSASTTVNLSVDNPAASAPASVLIPAGEVSASFAISTVPTTAERAVRITASLASGDARTVLLRVQPEAPPPPPPGDDSGDDTEPEREGPVIARWIRVLDNDCEDAGPIQPPITLEGFFTNDLYLGFEDPPTVAGAGSPIPLIVDSPPEVGLTIAGGEFFQHPFGGNAPPGNAPQTTELPSCLPFDSHITIAGAEPTFLPGRSLPLTDWPSPMDAAWFTIRFADAVVEQDAARFGDNRFYIRIARLTAPSGVRVRGVVDALFPGVVEAGGVRVEIPDEPVIWGEFDLNADGLVDAADARVLSAKMAAPAPADRPDADLNGDGAVSEPDMRLLIDAIRKR